MGERLLQPPDEVRAEARHLARAAEGVDRDRLAWIGSGGQVGRATLLALSNQEEARFGYDAWAGYTSLMDLFLSELIDPRWGKTRARAG